MANDHGNLFATIVAGLVAGIGLIVLFAMIFVPPEQHAPTSSTASSYMLTIGNKTYEIPYHFSSEEGKIHSMEADPNVSTIRIGVSVRNYTTLEIHLPIEMLKQLEVSGYRITEELAVFVDDVSLDATWQHTDREQIATIPLEQGTESIEIVGTYPI